MGRFFGVSVGSEGESLGRSALPLPLGCLLAGWLAGRFGVSRLCVCVSLSVCSGYRASGDETTHHYTSAHHSSPDPPPVFAFAWPCSGGGKGQKKEQTPT